MKKRFRVAAAAISMTFDRSLSDESPSIVQPMRESQLQEEPGIEPISAFSSVTRESENVISVSHETDPAKNIQITIQGSAQTGDYRMENLPSNFKNSLDGKYETSFIEKYPDVALRTIIREAKQMIDGLRPFSEFSHLLSQACVIKRENPALVYKIVQRIARGG